MTKHTHREITDTNLRLILANELLVLRAALRRGGSSMRQEWVHGVRMGLETFARRVEAVEKHGMMTVYAQNYK